MAERREMIINVVIFTFLLYESVDLQTYDDTKRLKDTLFDASRYRTEVKPIHNQSDSVRVNVSHSLKAVTEVNVPDGYALMVSELEIKWKDEYLFWNSTEYNGIEHINLQKGSFWTPAVQIIYERENQDVNVLEERYAPEWLSKDGVVSIYQTVTVRAKCNSVISLYPFDSHDCFVTVMSTKYDIDDVKLHSGQDIINLNEIGINKQWEVKNASIYAKTYFKGQHCFDALIVSMTVERRFTFTTYQRFIPMTALMLLNMLTPFVPPDSGERVTLCITLVLALIVATDSVTDELPKDTTEVSMITIYSVIYNFLSILTVAWSVLILCLFKRRGMVPVSLIKILKVTIKTNNTYVQTGQCQDKATSDSTCDEDICNITWQDITKKMDKVYFYCFLGIYMGLAAASLIIFFIRGIV